MANVRTYQIVINGVQESIDAVENLNKQLNILEEKIKQLEVLNSRLSSVADNIASITNTEVKTSPTSTENTRNIGDLDAEEKLRNQIVNLEDKIIAARNDEYQILLKQKQELKEIVTEQKAQTAEARLGEKAYANTMQGLKQELADIKAVMQTTDLGDEKFKDLVGRAGQLTEKLKEIEKQYGVFSRSVGNYASAAEGFKNFSIEVAGATQEFDSAKQALMELKKEMQTLSAKKDMGIISEEESERLKSLIPTVKELESSIKDAGKPMDALMDTMQSVVAIAQAGKGLSALFGLDGNKIEESIQKLVALQNVMQSLQTMQKQMQTGEGLFGYFSKANQALDAFILKAKTGTASMRALGKAATAASVAIKAIGKAFAWVSIAMVAFDLIKGIFSKENNDEMERQKNTLEAINNIVTTGAKGYAQANTNLKLWLKTIDSFNGSAKQEKKALEDLNKATNGLTSGCKTLAEAKQKIIDSSDDYIKMMKLEAEATAMLQLYTEEFAKHFRAEQLLTGFTQNLPKMMKDAAKKSVDASAEELNRLNDLIAGKQVEAASLRSKLFGDKSSDSAKTKNEIVDYEKELQQLRLDAMKDGLNKRLMQFEEEKRQTLNKLKGNQKAYLEAEKIFEERRSQIIISAREELSKELEELERKNLDEELDIKREFLKNEIDFYDTWLNGYGEPPAATITPRFKIDSGATSVIKDSMDDIYLSIEKAYGKIKVVETDYATQLKQNLENRVKLVQDYYKNVEKFEKTRIEKKYESLRTDLDLEEEQREKSLFKEKEEYSKTIDRYVEYINTLNQKRDEQGKFNSKTDEENYNKAQEDLEKALKEEQEAEKNHELRLISIRKEFYTKRMQLDESETKEISSRSQKEYDYLIDQYRAFLSDMNAATNQQPIMNDFGIVNVKKTKENYKAIKESAIDFVKSIDKIKEGLELKVSLNEIDKDEAKAIESQLNDIQNSAGETVAQVQGKLKELGTELWESINQWIQQIGQAATSIMSSFSEITSNHYEKQIEEQEKYIEEYENLLDKQKEATQEYADAVDEIENELSTSRGDRRQQLIDALNAELAAQRASLAEEKRIEKEKERAEEKKKKLEHDQAVAEKRMSVWQARLNAVMAVSMAAVNKWPIPAIPMMALAAAVGAAQIAAAESQNIPSYGEGGIIQGKSHREGGVKAVVGGRQPIELEGKEYIIRKSTATENINLLDYINKSQRKLNLNDFIEFYSGNKAKNSITRVSPKSKFADGGQIPSLRNDIDISDRMYKAMEDYANRPSYVQVVDIIDRTERLNEVKVISGLEV